VEGTRDGTATLKAHRKHQERALANFEPSVDPDLPEAPSLQLQRAINFTLFGLAFHRQLDPPGTEQALLEVFGVRQGAMMHGIDMRDLDAFERTAGKLDRSLSNAAFRKLLRFTGTKAGSEAHRKISHTYFREPRGFVGSNDEIRHSPCDADPYSVAKRERFPDQVDWREVDMGREGFVQWIAESLPELLPFVGKDVRARQVPMARVLRARRGRKPKYAWPTVKAYAFNLLNERGDYDSRPTKDWAKQADLERALLEFMGQTLGKEAAVSTLRRSDRIPAWVAEWRTLVSKGQ
jgi:hypothetical protein